MLNKHFTDDQMQLIYSAIDSEPNDPTLTMIEILAMTAIRGDELMRVRFSDVNFSVMQLTVWRGSKGSQARTCALTPELTLKILKLRDSLDKQAHDFLFSTVSSGKPATALRMIRAKLERIKAKNWPGQVLPGLHGLRHTKAVRAYKSGADLYTIQHLLGHKSLSSTEHYFPRVDQAELTKIQLKR